MISSVIRPGEGGRQGIDVLARPARSARTQAPDAMGVTLRPTRRSCGSDHADRGLIVLGIAVLPS
jgi:hypothetical protein